MKKQAGRRQHRTRAGISVDKPGPPIGLERAFTVEQIAQTGVACRARLYLDIKAGRLKAIKIGRSTRITESAYRAYLEEAPTL